MHRSMVDIQSATTEIRRGKKDNKKKIEETTGQKYNGLPITMGGHKNQLDLFRHLATVQKFYNQEHKLNSEQLWW